mmetsp:Transcript_197/g.628  ORF Transcript_197/g.628 Transcript_197/m.628 type:complete len:213 (+) Transcript_197:202-840(+)
MESSSSSASVTSGGIVADVDMCCYAFDVLQSQLRGKKLPRVPESIPETTSTAVFITWKKRGKDGRRYHLRGCIGTLTMISLHEGLKTYSLAAAFQDRRFPPIGPKELHDLQVCVSLLIDFEIAPNGVYDWVVGEHGLIIDFRDEDKQFSATYLPDVCSEQGWSKVECMQSLIRKSGYVGPITRELLREIKLTRYRSTKCALYYSEYRRLLTR